MQEKDYELDLERSERIDMPEAIYCQTKTADQCRQIISDMINNSTDAIVATRVQENQIPYLDSLRPDKVMGTTYLWNPRPANNLEVAIVAAGTSDLVVASEASLTLEGLGYQISNYNDVGVAGLHRLLNRINKIAAADLVIAIAGMEGSMPTVLAGLIAKPIIALPTSTGYGASFEGVTAMLSMLASCAPGIVVVGIDNGYGAACAAHRILKPLTTD